MRVLFLPEVQDYFLELAEILYQQDYFSFEENAVRYAVELFDDIESTLHAQLRKPAPPFFEKYGHRMYYAVFRKSRHTQWYVFFNIYLQQSEEIFLVRYITNNHVSAHKL